MCCRFMKVCGAGEEVTTAQQQVRDRIATVDCFKAYVATMSQVLVLNSSDPERCAA